MSREGRRPRVWSWAEGHLGPGLEPGDKEVRSGGPGKQVCIPGGSDAGNHTCHGGLWCHQSARSQDLHPRSGPVGGQPVPPHQLIYLLVILSKWVRVLAPWKQAQLHNGFDATGHLLCCVAVVIGAQPDQHNLGADVF